jgi:hypothetical protein
MSSSLHDGAAKAAARDWPGAREQFLPAANLLAPFIHDPTSGKG